MKSPYPYPHERLLAPIEETRLEWKGENTPFQSRHDDVYFTLDSGFEETEHIFIEGNDLPSRFASWTEKTKPFVVGELGFGTGLNVLVTIDAYLKIDEESKINYFSVEKYPVLLKEAAELSYSELFSNHNVKDLSLKIHDLEWEVANELTPGFSLTKIEKDFFDLKSTELPPIDLVYFDCFGARVQPDLWEMELLEIVADKMNSGGLLTTYSSKGSVRRNLIELGFEVEKKQGPPGKREMMIAWKK
ncbi:MAG: peptidase [Proteobacteria bacterium]|nr:MAG: peptidase [Pseudomonadota bacterium]